MNVERLRVTGLRCLDDVSVDLAPGINVFVGDNGAGKTSLLESVFLLSHGRSFRAGSRDALLMRGASVLHVFAELRRHDSAIRRLGLGREGSRWRARVDGEPASLSQLVGECAVVSFDPGSHALIAGSADERRRFLDWGLFHVEQDFFPAWRRYQRALKQRNALLRSGATDSALFEPWESELGAVAEVIAAWRAHYLQRLEPLLRVHVGDLLPELGEATLGYRRGWSDELPLQAVLSAQRPRELARGHTTQGTHRADWSIAFREAPLREHLSRGQEKLTALACLLAQADLYAADHDDWPIVCLDDLASELDANHRDALVSRLRQSGAQILVSGTDLPDALASGARVFHVEQGVVTPLL